MNKLKGIMDATLIVVHKEKDIQNIFDMMHQHQVEVKTQLHNHLENHQCLEIYLLHGEGKNIQKIIKNLKITASLVKLIPL